jgi:photosystem II stability/assembly factor-like uncharacterized protein
MEKKMRISLIILLIILISSNLLISQLPNQFKPTNGPYGGYIIGFCYDNTNNDLYVNSSNIFNLNRTNNRWERRFSVLDTIPGNFYELIFADSIYFMTYTAGNGSDVIWGCGLYRSTDKGQSWIELKDIRKNLFNNIRSIINLDDSIYIAACGFGAYVLKSSDYGLTWKLTMNGIDSLDLAHADSFDQLEKLNVNGKNIIFLRGFEAGIFRSTNNGDSWQKISNDLPKSDNYYYNSYYSIGTTKYNELFISSDSGIFRSIDYGDSWAKIIEGLESWKSYELYFLKSDNEGNVYGGGYGTGIIRLKHDTTNWEFLNNGMLPISMHDISFDKENNDIYVATDAGIYKSTNNGNSWFFFNDGINYPLEIKSLAYSKNIGIIAGTVDNGIYFSSDKGESWHTCNNGIKSPSIIKMKIDNLGNIYAGDYYKGNFYKSTNNGFMWDTLTTGSLKVQWCLDDISINSKDYVITNLVYDSTFTYLDTVRKINKYILALTKDGGKTWDKIWNSKKYIYSFVFDNKDNIYLSADSSIYKSTDYGNSWQETFKFSKYLGINCFLVTKNNSIFAGTESNFIFRSTDEGNTWENLDKDFPQKISINCLSTLDLDNEIICGSKYHGYFISHDNGDSWLSYDFPEFGSQIEENQFNDLVYDGNSTLYAATYGGVYKWDGVLSVPSIKSTQFDLSIYPNPFSEFTTIQYSLPTSTNVRLSIYDIFGREVAVLDDGWQELGRYNYQLSIVNYQLLNGIYFCKMQAGSESKVFKIIRID